MYSSYVGTAKATNEKVSIKQFMVQRYDPKMIVQEVANLARLSHESFPKVLELFHTDTSVYMVTSYQDIFRLKNAVDLRNHSTSLSLPEIRRVFKCLSSAVLHCHDHQLLLRSILPENVIIQRRATAPKKAASNKVKQPNNSGSTTDDDSNQNSGADIDVKICDVSMAVQVTKSEANLYQDHPLFDWSHIPYVSPEIGLKLPYSFACDYWALGVLLYMMISAHLPFTVEDPMDRALLLQRIKDSAYSFDLPVWASTRPEIKNLIRNLLMSDPLMRINVPEMRRNVWMVQG
jgi:protein serine kinase H